MLKKYTKEQVEELLESQLVGITQDNFKDIDIKNNAIEIKLSEKTGYSKFVKKEYPKIIVKYEIINGFYYNPSFKVKREEEKAKKIIYMSSKKKQ